MMCCAMLQMIIPYATLHQTDKGLADTFLRPPAGCSRGHQTLRSQSSSAASTHWVDL